MEHSIIDIILHRDKTHEEIPETKEYKEISDKRYKIYEKFREMLNDEQKKIFDEFEELETEERCIKAENYFRAGVKVGVRLASECMFD